MPGSTRAVVYVHLIPPARGGHDSLPVAGAAKRRRENPSAGQGELPEIQLVQYAVLVCGAARSERKSSGRRDFTELRRSHYVFTGDTKHLPGGENGIPNPPIVTLAENTAELNVLAANAAEPAPNAVLEGRRLDALERLWHRTFPAGRFDRRGGSFRENHGDRSEESGRLEQHRPRARAGREIFRRRSK